MAALEKRLSVFDNSINRDRIAAIQHVIGPYIRRTPIVQTDGADFGHASIRLTLKLELMQCSGSFKARGAFAHLLTRKIPPAGVAAASGGNHGAAVAYAAAKLGVPARIFVPTISSAAKVDRIRRYGADLVIAGDRYADALASSDAWIAASGALRVHAYDQVETLLGQGTIAAEIEEQASDLDTLLVPVGGGGLIGGIAAWYAGKLAVIGVEPKAAPTLARALEEGRPVDVEIGGLAADSLGASRVGECVFPIAQRYVRQVIVVTDDAIRSAQEVLWSEMRIAAEPGGATALAALLSGEYRPRSGENVGVIISGGNTTMADFGR